VRNEFGKEGGNGTGKIKREKREREKERQRRRKRERDIRGKTERIDGCSTGPGRPHHRTYQPKDICDKGRASALRLLTGVVFLTEKKETYGKSRVSNTIKTELDTNLEFKPHENTTYECQNSSKRPLTINEEQ